MQQRQILRPITKAAVGRPGRDAPVYALTVEPHDKVFLFSGRNHNSLSNTESWNSTKFSPVTEHPGLRISPILNDNKQMRTPAGAPTFELSPIKAIELAASRLEGSISLAQGVPYFPAPPFLADFISERIANGACDKYSLTPGLLEFREEVASALAADHLHYDPEGEIIATVGSIEGITASLLALVPAGSEVLIPSPSYTSYAGAVRLAGSEPCFVPLNEERGFDLDPDRIAAAITKRTRALIFCHPNNPTGTIFSEATTREMMRIAAAHRLLVITDEVYKDFYYTADPHFTPAALPEARAHVVRVCSFSKAYALTGWRIGFLHTDRPLAQRILRYHDAMVTCAPVVSQYAAIAALRHGADYRESFMAELRARRALTIQALDSLSHVLDYQVPKASYFVFPRVKDTVPLARDSQKLAYDILEKQRLALVPGIAFGPEGESHLRICFGRERTHIEEGMQRLCEYFASGVCAKRQRPHPRGTPALPTRPPISHQIVMTSARHLLARSGATVIGIAGARAKTVFRRTISDLLNRWQPVRGSLLSYNTPIGMALSILQLPSPKTRAERLLFPARLLARLFGESNHQRLFVLEYGIRSEQDGFELREFVRPDWLVISGLWSPDESLDTGAIQAGIQALARGLPGDRILGVADDPLLAPLGLSPEHGQLLSQSQLDAGSLRTVNGTYQISLPLVGASEILASIAAVRLGELLGMPRATIQEWLSPRPSTGDHSE